MDTPTPDNAARATPEWSSAKPISEGAYYIRGFNICREEQYEALVQVRLHHYFGEDDAELCCNLHASTSEEDMDEWIPVIELQDDFEWLGPLVPAATVTALEAEVSALSHELDCVNANWQASMAHAKTLRAKADAAERRVAELTGLLSDTAGNLRRMANDEFAECDQVRLEHVVNRIEDHLTGARAK